MLCDSSEIGLQFLASISDLISQFDSGLQGTGADSRCCCSSRLALRSSTVSPSDLRSRAEISLVDDFTFGSSLVDGFAFRSPQSKAFKVLAKNYLGIKNNELFPQIEGLLKQADITSANVVENLIVDDDNEGFADACL
ncbi:AAA-ATPase [Camellia lanceoleosa]|uniref:AAA-ATPase n=1 Tax=Camellia lanceoleosa TaxID=1840588 RepID=A0ACC0FYE0_9ERIC|nr:AAA-ATPase [Camellia lanceoleosa]